MISKQLLGKSGEAVARDHLAAKGFQFVAANYRTRFGEVDLIMREGDTLVFVEVKTRSGFSAGHPEEAVTPKKLSHITRVARTYLAMHQTSPGWRIDVVSVSQRGVLHLENVTA